MIEPSTCPWSSPVRLVKKSEPGEYRFCVNYRKLNAVTKKDVYPLPIISENVSRLSGASLFNALDLQSGYWQVPVDNRN